MDFSIPIFLCSVQVQPSRPMVTPAPSYLCRCSLAVALPGFIPVDMYLYHEMTRTGGCC
jgi:hypothetical protein